MHLHVETPPGKPLRAFGVSNKKKESYPGSRANHHREWSII